MTQPYRPKRAPVEWSSVRDLTLGDVVDRTRRHGGYAGIVAVILVVAVFFPGRFPISRQLVPSGGLAGDDRGAEQLTQVLGATAERALGETGRSVSLADSSSNAGASPFEPGALGDGLRGPEGGGPPAPSPSAPTACGPDARLPAPTIGPTLEQVHAAQAALEEGIGRPSPVDLVGTFHEQVCGAGVNGANGSNGATADLLLLGRLVPRSDTILLATLGPVIRPSCDTVTGMAIMEALATRNVSKATGGAVMLCAAARFATVDPAAVDPAAVDPAAAPDGGAPSDVERPSFLTANRPLWSAIRRQELGGASR